MNSMNKATDAADALIARAVEESEFRDRLVASPKKTIEKEFGVTLAEGHEIHVHEETYSSTHIVLPPRSKISEAEREAAKTGAASLEFLKKTMYDPAPPLRPPAPEPEAARTRAQYARSTSQMQAEKASAAVLPFLDIHNRRERGMALHPVQCRRPGYSKAFRKTALCLGALRPCPGTLRRGAGQSPVRLHHVVSCRNHRISRIVALLPPSAPGS